MALRGKDFCNCDHARMLREAIEEAVRRAPTSRDRMLSVLQKALDTDANACLDLWGDLKESE